MEKDSSRVETSKIYDLLVGKRGVMILGKDFMMVNYGNDFYLKDRTIIISGSTKSYESFSPKKDFPANVLFKEEGAHLAAVNVSHIEDCLYRNSDLDFDGLIKLLKTRGMKFERR